MLSETHNVHTIDHWILKTHEFKPFVPNKKHILLWHGLSTCSDIFLGDNSLSHYLLANNYTVWLGNTRGNKYTRHASGIQSWEWGMDEILLDVVATVDFILRETGVQSLVYCGFSQGML